MARLVCREGNKYYKHYKGQWIHPAATLVKSGDYSDWYECPICGTLFSVELPE